MPPKRQLPIPPSLSAADDGSASRPINLSLRPSLPDRPLAPPSRPLTSNMEGLLQTDLRPSMPRGIAWRRSVSSSPYMLDVSGWEGGARGRSGRDGRSERLIGREAEPSFAAEREGGIGSWRFGD